MVANAQVVAVVGVVVGVGVGAGAVAVVVVVVVVADGTELPRLEGQMQEERAKAKSTPILFDRRYMLRPSSYIKVITCHVFF